MKVFLLWALCEMVPIAMFGQTARIDSLKDMIQKAPTQARRLNTIVQLLEESETLPKDTLWNYALAAKLLAAKLKDGQSASLAVLGQANAYLRWDKVDSARLLIEGELAKYRPDREEERSIWFKLARAKIDCMGSQDNYKEGIAQVYDVMRQAERYNDSVVMAESLNTLGAWYYDMDRVEEGRQWGYKALAYTRDEPKFYPVLASLCLNLGDNCRWVHKDDSAFYFMNLGTQYSRRIENLYDLSVGLQKITTVYLHKKDFVHAEASIKESMALIRKVEGNANQEEKLIVLAEVYRQSGRVDQAIAALKDGLVWLNDGSSNLQRTYFYDELAQCYKIKGDSMNYISVLEKIIEGKDSFYQINSANAIAELQTKYDVEKKEATIARQRLTLIRANYLMYGSLIAIILIGIIIWLLFKGYRRRQERQAAEAVAAAEDAERRRIAADLHDNLGAQLSYIKRNVNFILDRPEGFSDGDERKYLGYVNDTAQTAMVDLRETIWVLNRDEVEIQEFVDKLKSYLRQQLMGREGISWDFGEVIGTSWKLSSGEVMNLFRIVQEVISNIIKHAAATDIQIRFESKIAGNYQLEINDNGKGFDVGRRYEGHYGMENIQQRSSQAGAKVTMESDPGKGTRVILVKK